jgi:aryl-alcohol dehydrogenase-like predicted oxidoreductase
MRYNKFGSTGLEVSNLLFGCMAFGTPGQGLYPWSIDEDAARPLILQAIEAGINFFDTANMYSAGRSEEILGKILRETVKRDDVVIATKVYYRMRPGANGAGLSRKAIFAEIDNSLRRLQTDYVDLYQVHRWDYATPIEETLEALNDVVKAGKARYIGASSMHAWQFSKALYTSRLNGWAEFASMQNHLNLLYREEEREMLPLCRDEQIAVIPWSPLARGRLARDWNDTSVRQESDAAGRVLYNGSLNADKAIAEKVGAIAKARGVSRASVALAWVAQQRGVTAPIVGVSKPQHILDAIAATNLSLSEDEMAVLESPYITREVSGFE